MVLIGNILNIFRIEKKNYELWLFKCGKESEKSAIENVRNKIAGLVVRKDQENGKGTRGVGVLTDMSRLEESLAIGSVFVKNIKLYLSNLRIIWVCS